MDEPEAPGKSALPDIQRASLIRATKMKAVSCRLFVDF
jgi:hypothetical protein